MNSKIRFLKSFLQGEERIFESGLLHSMVVDGKKSVFKEVVITFNEMYVLELRGEYAVDGFEIRL